MPPIVLDNDSGLLESLLNQSFPQARLHASEQSDSNLYSATDSSAGHTLVLRPTRIVVRQFDQDGPFETQIPHPTLGIPQAGARSLWIHRSRWIHCSLR